MGKNGRFNTYRKISGKWKDLIPFFQALGISVIVAFLFYKSIYGILSGLLIFPFWLKLKSEEIEAEKRGRLSAEFKEFMMLIVASLQTGYSLERAIKQSEVELHKLYPNGCIIAGQVHILNQKIAMNVQLEKAFFEFAKAIELEEALSLAEIISFAKRSGGNYGKHIRDTALKIEENILIKQEIETITTEKRLELKVMCIMPIGILAYISLTSPDFITPLYGNVLGAGLMSLCLTVYGALIILGRKIIDIKI